MSSSIILFRAIALQEINRRLADFRRHLCRENDQWTNAGMLNDKKDPAMHYFPCAESSAIRSALLPLFLKVAQTNQLCAIQYPRAELFLGTELEFGISITKCQAAAASFGTR